MAALQHRLTETAQAGARSVIAEERTVLLQWDDVAIRCSPDAAHALADLLFDAALKVEQRRMALERAHRAAMDRAHRR